MREKNGSSDCIWHELIFRHSDDIFSLKNSSRKYTSRVKVSVCPDNQNENLTKGAIRELDKKANIFF